MEFLKSKINGAFIIETEKFADERGDFSVTYDKQEFQKHGLENEFVLSSLSYNRKKGTLRGMHFQLSPSEETKIVKCIQGKIFDVIVDLRKNSSTFKQWESNELSSSDNKILYIPKGVAHGFQTLEDDSKIFYQISEYHNPNFYRGVRFDDSNFEIKWPLPISVISTNDKKWEIFSDTE